MKSSSTYGAWASKTDARLGFGHYAVGLLMACSLTACSKNTETRPPADASTDRIGTDSLAPGTPDVSPPDTVARSETGPVDAPMEAAIPPSDALINPLEAGNADTAGPRGIDVPQSDLPIAIDADIDFAQGSPIDGLASEAGGEAEPAFTCSSLGPIASDVSQRLCFDFSDPSDSGEFTPEAGTWSVVDGTYHGVGPMDGQTTCPGGPTGGSGMTTSVLSTLTAADVRVHARMTSWTNPDKVLVLRSRPSGNRIELNFRSYFVYEGNHGGDLAISALFDCKNISFVLPDVIPIPQYDFQAIVVDVQLRGQRLTVSLDGKQVYDATPTTTDMDGGTWQLPSAPGSVGFGVFQDGEDVFDDLIVEILK